MDYIMLMIAFILALVSVAIAILAIGFLSQWALEDWKVRRRERHSKVGELYFCTRCRYVHKRVAPCNTPER